MMEDVATPLGSSQSLKRALEVEQVDEGYPQTRCTEGSAATNAENGERNGVVVANDNQAEPASKRVKLDNGEPEAKSHRVNRREKVKGMALIKEE